MAYFHSQALRELNQPATRFYTTARAYLSGDTGWDNWQQLGLQGLAEVVARLDQENNSNLLASALPHMPEVPRNVILGFLENASPDVALTIALSDGLAEAMRSNADAATLAAYCRAMSASVSVDHRQQILDVVLAHPHASSLELLSAIGSRCWHDLEGTRLNSYLESLAKAGAETFMALVADLMTLPGMRGRILEAFRHPQRSETLSTAIGALMAGARGGVQ